MSFLGTMATVTNNIAIGGSLISLAAMSKALVTPNPNAGIGGLMLFDIPLGEQLNLRAQITDHFSETNLAIQDHIAFEPAKITLRGVVGELVYTKSEVEKYVEAVLAKLGPLGVIKPKQSASAYQYLAAYNQLNSALSAVAASANSLASAFGISMGALGKNKQQYAYWVLSSLYEGRGLLTVETPWKTFDNMAIESLSFDQHEESKDYSEVTVVFKEIRMVETGLAMSSVLGKIAAQLAPVAVKGKVVGVNKSLLASGLDKVKALVP